LIAGCAEYQQSEEDCTVNPRRGHRTRIDQPSRRNGGGGGRTTRFFFRPKATTARPIRRVIESTVLFGQSSGPAERPAPIAARMAPFFRVWRPARAPDCPVDAAITAPSRPAHQHAAGERKLAPLIDPSADSFREEFHGAALLSRGYSFSGRRRGSFMALAPRQTPHAASTVRRSEPTASAGASQILELSGKHLVAHAMGIQQQRPGCRRHDPLKFGGLRPPGPCRRANSG